MAAPVHICISEQLRTGGFSCSPFPRCPLLSAPVPLQQGKGRGCFASAAAAAAGEKSLLCCSRGSAVPALELGENWVISAKLLPRELSHLTDGFWHHVVEIQPESEASHSQHLFSRATGAFGTLKIVCSTQKNHGWACFGGAGLGSGASHKSCCGNSQCSSSGGSGLSWGSLLSTLLVAAFSPVM